MSRKPYSFRNASFANQTYASVFSTTSKPLKPETLLKPNALTHRERAEDKKRSLLYPQSPAFV